MIGIAVSILNYCTTVQTLKCVSALLSDAGDHLSSVRLTIWVADNGSNPEEYYVLQNGLHPLEGVYLRQYECNVGFAAGHNRNVGAILAEGRPDFIWLLNSDCLVHDGCIEALLTCALERPEIGIWGATLLESDGRTIQCAGGCAYNSWLSLYRQHGRGVSVRDRDRLGWRGNSYVAGASLFLPISTLEHGLYPPKYLRGRAIRGSAPLLNETFFLYFEELDLVERLKPQTGVSWCRDALVTHAGGQSTGTAGNLRSAQAEYHSTLSALKFTQLYYPGRLWIMAPARYMLKCAQLLFTGNYKLIDSVNSAYRDFSKWRHESRA